MVEEIESAIDRLPPEDYKRVIAWLRIHEQSRWDDQMDRDSSAGTLDFIFNEADPPPTSIVSGRREHEIYCEPTLLGTL